MTTSTDSFEDNDITPKPLRVRKVPQTLHMIPKRHSSVASLRRHSPVHTRKSYRSEPFPAGEASELGFYDARQQSLAEKPSIERKLFRRFRDALSGTIRTFSSSSEENCPASRGSSDKFAASRNVSAESSVTSVFTPKFCIAGEVEISSNPLRAPPPSLLVPLNSRKRSDSSEGKWSPIPETPPLAQAKIGIIPEIDIADLEKTQFIWVAVEITAERFVAQEPQGRTSHGSLLNLALDIAPGSGCTMEKTLGDSTRDVLCVGQTWTLVINLAVRPAKKSTVSADYRVDTSPRSSSVQVMSELQSMLATNRQTILTATLYYSHSLLPENTQLSTHERCSLSLFSPWSLEAGKVAHKRTKASKEAVQLRIARFVEEQIWLSGRTDHISNYQDGAMMLADIFGTHGERAVPSVQRYVQQMQKLSKLFRWEDDVKHGVGTVPRSGRPPREFITKVMTEAEIVWSETIGTLPPLNPVRVSSFPFERRQVFEEESTAWTKAAGPSTSRRAGQMSLPEGNNGTSRGRETPTYDQSWSYGLHAASCGVGPDQIIMPNTKSESSPVPASDTLPRSPTTNTVVRTRPKQICAVAAIVSGTNLKNFEIRKSRSFCDGSSVEECDGDSVVDEVNTLIETSNPLQQSTETGSQGDWEDENEDSDAAAEIWRSMRRISYSRDSPTPRKENRQNEGGNGALDGLKDSDGHDNHGDTVSAPWL